MNGAFRLGVVAAATARATGPGPGPGPSVFGWGASQGGATTLSNSDRTISAAPSVGRVCVAGKMGRGSGKRYFEITHSSVVGAPNNRIGIATASWNKNNIVGEDANGAAVSFHGFSYQNGYTGDGNMGTPVPSAVGAVTQIAVDFDTGKVWVGVNAGWKWSGNPAAGTNPLFTLLSSSDYFPALTMDGVVLAWSVTLAERAADFVYSPPAGFSPWVA